MQKKSPSDYVIATGKQYTVREFVNLTLKYLKIKHKWKGAGINSKCYDEKGRCIIECDIEYYRPLEVDTLLGDPSKGFKQFLKTLTGGRITIGALGLGTAQGGYLKALEYDHLLY